jgi:hypothetical protein
MHAAVCIVAADDRSTNPAHAPLDLVIRAGHRWC